MPIKPYLAMTAAEMSFCASLPEKIAWMACHFSACGDGLTNCPAQLPPGSLLILDDSTPPLDHDLNAVVRTLFEAAEKHRCDGILIDFQRQTGHFGAALCRLLQDSPPCPIAVSPALAVHWSGALFLPPVPPSRVPEKALAPWAGRELWLEISSEPAALHLTEEGAQLRPAAASLSDLPHHHNGLMCSYQVEVFPEEAVFTLGRSMDDQLALLKKVRELGVTKAVGLYQEFAGLFQ